MSGAIANQDAIIGTIKAGTVFCDFIFFYFQTCERQGMRITPCQLLHAQGTQKELDWTDHRKTCARPLTPRFLLLSFCGGVKAQFALRAHPDGSHTLCSTFHYWWSAPHTPGRHSLPENKYMYYSTYQYKIVWPTSRKTPTKLVVWHRAKGGKAYFIYSTCIHDEI